MKVYVVIAISNDDPPYTPHVWNEAIFLSEKKAEQYIDDMEAIQEIEKANNCHCYPVEYGIQPFDAI